jgi:hypothetical protein
VVYRTWCHFHRLVKYLGRIGGFRCRCGDDSHQPSRRSAERPGSTGTRRMLSSLKGSTSMSHTVRCYRGNPERSCLSLETSERPTSARPRRREPAAWVRRARSIHTLKADRNCSGSGAWRKVGRSPRCCFSERSNTWGCKFAASFLMDQFTGEHITYFWPWFSQTQNYTWTLSKSWAYHNYVCNL